MSTQTRKVTFTGLTKTQGRILTEAGKLANTNGIVCRDTLAKKTGLKSSNLTQNLVKMRRANNFPFSFVCRSGRKRENISVTIKVPTICIAETPVSTDSKEI